MAANALNEILGIGGVSASQGLRNVIEIASRLFRSVWLKAEGSARVRDETADERILRPDVGIVVDRCTPGGLAKDGDSRGIPAERCNVAVNPFNGQALI